jgi:hypothetical protein
MLGLYLYWGRKVGETASWVIAEDIIADEATIGLDVIVHAAPLFHISVVCYHEIRTFAQLIERARQLRRLLHCTSPANANRSRCDVLINYLGTSIT